MDPPPAPIRAGACALHGKQKPKLESRAAARPTRVPPRVETLAVIAPDGDAKRDRYRPAGVGRSEPSVGGETERYEQVPRCGGL